jgi:hypothetical protein
VVTYDFVNLGAGLSTKVLQLALGIGRVSGDVALDGSGSLVGVACTRQLV